MLPPMIEILLYTRPGCHLCEKALAVCRECGVEPRSVDISEDLELLRAYRDRIPVLRRTDTDGELGWPFDAGALSAFLNGRSEERG